jgi:2-(1,2-epoxy-1,2-dihydrophenyl)acetyl-CoA isomerase
MGYETLVVDREEGALRIKLNRPEVLNALSLKMLEELRTVLEGEAVEQAVRAVMLTGAGRGFCAGADLAGTEVAGGIGPLVERYYNPVVRALCGLDKPVIAAVNGVAAGAGMSLALACDMRLLSSDAAFALGFTRIALAMDASCSYFLPRLVGLGRAFELAYSGRKVAAQEALELGLGEQLFDASTFVEEAWAWVRSLAKGPTVAFAAVKEELYASHGNTLEAQLALEADAQDRASRTRDFAEGVRAFREKRQPSFEGR